MEKLEWLEIQGNNDLTEKGLFALVGMKSLTNIETDFDLFDAKVRDSFNEQRKAQGLNAVQFSTGTRMSEIKKNMAKTIDGWSETLVEVEEKSGD